MLPFLKNQNIHHPHPEDQKTVGTTAVEDLSPLEIAIKELFNAKSDKDRAEAFKAACDLYLLEPHDEE